MEFKSWLINENKFDKKYLGEVKGYKVFTVDDKKIRDSSLADEEFSDFAIHHDFPKLVPKNEVWISDREKNSDDERVITTFSAIKRAEALKRGVSKDKAWDIADRYEKSEREKLNPKHYNNKKELNDKIKLRLIKKIGKIEVWLVNGDLVRDNYRIEFAEGGNPKAYYWIPKNEIWIDNEV